MKTKQNLRCDTRGTSCLRSYACMFGTHDKDRQRQGTSGISASLGHDRNENLCELARLWHKALSHRQRESHESPSMRRRDGAGGGIAEPF